MKECGRPDIVIDSPEICALLEVKINPSRSLTANQEPAICEVKNRRNYLDFLARSKANERWLLFLVPENWKFLQMTRELLAELKRNNPLIRTGIVHWERILAMTAHNPNPQIADPLVQEFRKLLERSFGPITFFEEEIKMLYSTEIPIRAIRKLDYIVTRVREECKSAYKFDPLKSDKTGEEYGLNFKNGNGNYFFWFGIWSPFWETFGKPLCFGISDEMGPTVKKAFLAAYNGETVLFDNWTIGWIPEDDLREGTNGNDPVYRIWNRLKPILEKVSAAAN